MDHSTVTVESKNGRLQIRDQVLKAVSLKPFRNVFLMGENGARVEFTNSSGKPVGMIIPSEIDGVHNYVKRDPFVPTEAEMEMMTGEYSNDEAEVTLKVSVENGGLVIRRRPNTKIVLTPIFRNAFRSSLGTVRFDRAGDGHVLEMRVSDPRVWDLGFHRVQ